MEAAFPDDFLDSCYPPFGIRVKTSDSPSGMCSDVMEYVSESRSSVTVEIFASHRTPLNGLFCARRTLSFVYVLEFSTVRKEKLDVEEEVFHA